MLPIVEDDTSPLTRCVPDLPPDEVDHALGEAARWHKRSKARLAFWLHEVQRRALYLGYGFTNIAAYGHDRHGLSHDMVYRYTRAAEACEKSPLLREAYARGQVALTKIDVLKPVLHGDERDAEWVERAKKQGRRRLARAVKTALGLDTDEVDVHFKLSPRTRLILFAALERARRVAGDDGVSDDEAIELVAADYLSGRVEESEELMAALAAIDAPQQCPSSLGRPRAVDSAAEDETGVSTEHVASAPIEAVPAASVAPISVAEVAPAQPRSVEEVERCIDVMAGGAVCSEATLRAVLARLDDAEKERVLRLWTLHRDGWRCRVPGCDARDRLEVDHIRSRAQAPERRFDPSNLWVLCSAHHERKTRGLLSVAVGPHDELILRLPDRWNEAPPLAP